MSLVPGGLLPWVELRFLKLDPDDGLVPNSGGFVYFYIAGTSTPLDTYAQSDLDPGAANPNPIELDEDGRPPDPIFLSPTAYKVVVEDLNNVQLYEVDEVEDVGATFAATFGTVQAEGGKDVTDGYIVLSTDRLVTVDSTGSSPAVVTLLAASEATQMLTIKNVGTGTVSIEPDGSDVIDGTAGAITMPAASGQDQPSLVLVSDGVSSWFIIASHLNP